MSFMSPGQKAKREADLERMRAKWRKERKTVKRLSGEVELLSLPDLARACRYAKRLAKNEALKQHLELAASYFDEAHNAPNV